MPLPPMFRVKRPELWCAALSRMLRRGLSMSMLLVAAVIMHSCSNDEPLVEEMRGGLQLSLGGISVEVSETRSTPEELGKPSDTDFHLNIVRQGNGATIYDGAFTEQKIKAAPGDYDITATYGDNPVLGLDRPYYVGSTTAKVVSTTEPTPVSLPVSVGNALVSVVFGPDAETAARFDRFYRDYGLQVAVGNNSISLTSDIADKSVYVRAGSTVALSFSGYLIAADRQVTLPISLSTHISSTLAAADHLIVTLSLEPNDESAIVTVVKAELEKVDLEGKVKYNWLPAPKVTTEHKYDRQNNLLGTDLSIAASFPDATWEATIHQGSESGNVVRRLSGTGALTSTYQLNPTWPYLPPGTYVATYKYYSKQGKAYNFSKTTEFTIDPPALTLTADAYTAHSKYEEGDVDAANACDRLTVYSPKVTWNVANNLLANNNYTKTYKTSIADKTKTVLATSNSMTLDDITEVPVSGNLYTLTVTANFCGQTVDATKQVRITGLPANFQPPTKATGWDNDDGTTDFESDHVRLGNWSWSNPHRIKNASWFNIPQGTRIALDYDIVLHRAGHDVTANVKMGGQEVVKVDNTEYLTDIHNTGLKQYNLTSVVTSVTCEGSWGSGATHTKVYKLHFKYGQ